MEKFKPVYDMTPEENAEIHRIAVEKQQELLQKIDEHRAKKAIIPNEDSTLVITPLMRKEATLREQELKDTLSDQE